MWFRHLPSTAVNQKVTKALEERGLKGQFQITQGKASEVAEKSKQYDLVISTTVLGGECHCPLSELHSCLEEELSQSLIRL